MVLSSALDNGNVFMCLIAILTSVVSAVYYLYIVKHMFFEKSEYMLNTSLKQVLNIQLQKFNGSILHNNDENTVNTLVASS
jgi:NADH:ubiquinone oxidoreductase subunit 2 (subunit N)